MPRLNAIVDAFDANLRGVDKLATFDRTLLEFTVAQVRGLHESLKGQGNQNPKMNGAATLQAIERVMENDSLRPQYQTIFNQGVVLLVSYFASALGDIFRHGVSERLNSNSAGPLFAEEIKLSLLELKERDWNLKEAAADLLIAKRDLSFQDMKATHRAFKDYLGVDMERDSRVNNIIVAQACRHVIVHSGPQVTERFLRQIASAMPRTLKPSLRLGERIQFVPAELELVAKEMRGYVGGLVGKLRTALRGDVDPK